MLEEAASGGKIRRLRLLSSALASMLVWAPAYGIAGPCANAIEYAVAEIDERFAMDLGTVRKAAAAAAGFWNKAAGRTSFKEWVGASVEPPLMTILLSYSPRQEKLQSICSSRKPQNGLQF